MSDHLSRIKNKTRLPSPDDGLCETCKKVEYKYYKKEKHVCKNCWDRDQYPNLSHMTDEELNQYRLENLKKVDDAKSSIVNANALKDRTVGFHI
jgi:hypothetical protein